MQWAVHRFLQPSAGAQAGAGGPPGGDSLVCCVQGITGFSGSPDRRASPLMTRLQSYYSVSDPEAELDRHSGAPAGLLSQAATSLLAGRRALHCLVQPAHAAGAAVIPGQARHAWRTSGVPCSAHNGLTPKLLGCRQGRQRRPASSWAVRGRAAGHAGPGQHSRRCCRLLGGLCRLPPRCRPHLCGSSACTRPPVL